MCKVYFFRGGDYVRYDVKNDATDPNYPLPLATHWSGLPATGIDAAINWGNGKTYFFDGPQYYRYDNKADHVDSGYPRPIANNWPGLTLDRVDACVNWGNGKAYFFRGSQYWSYDIAADRTDPDYPKSIAQDWPGSFPGDIDGAINWGNGKAYFFRDDQYVRCNVKSRSVDSGYPKSIAQYWKGLFSTGVRAPVMLGFAGIDRLQYPGDAVMQQLWTDTDLTWTGFYLAPAPSQSNTSWMGHFAALRNMGWGIAPVYVGQQQPGRNSPGSHIVTAAQGTVDAADAIALAVADGMSPGTVLYLDIETGGPIQSGLADYYRSWVQGVINGGFRPGVYCSYLLASQFQQMDNRPVFWIFNINKFAYGPNAVYKDPYPAPEPLFSSVPSAAAWQLSQNAQLVMPASQHVSPMDYDSCSVRNPLEIV